MPVGHLPQPLDEAEVLREARLLEARVVLAPVVLGQVRDPLTGHRAGQQAGAHRRVDDHPDSLALGEGEDLLLDLSRDQRVGRLQGLDGRDLLDAAQLLDVEVGDADVAHEALLLECGECAPAFFDVSVGYRPVDLVEVDRIDAEALEARLGLAQDRVALEIVHDRPPGPLDE